MFGRGRSVAAPWEDDQRVGTRRALVLVAALVLIADGACHKTPAPTPVTLQSITVAPSGYTVEQGVQLKASATGHYSDGTSKDLSASATWSSSATKVGTINASQRVFTVGTGMTTLSAASDGKSGTATLTVTPRKSFWLPAMGLWATFEDRGSMAHGGWFDGQLLHLWDEVDPVQGHTVHDEVALQLDAMQAMGVNVITFDLRASRASDQPGDPFVPPECPENPALGLNYPQPAAMELANLGALLDELQKRGMRMYLVLSNTHMEESPPTDNTTYLTAIFDAIGKHPAIDLIAFVGNANQIPGPNNTMICAGPAEPPLYQGPGSVSANYITFAIQLGVSRGVPARKLGTEIPVGFFDLLTGAPNTAGGFTDNHFWSPMYTMQQIFDAAGIAPADRTYALSFYEHQKCQDVFAGYTCTDETPHQWADDTLASISAMVEPGSRVLTVEMGALPPIDPAWATEPSYESLLRLMQKYGVEGGAFWRWANTNDDMDFDFVNESVPIKLRGLAFRYTTAQKILVDYAGWHVGGIQNGSFESGTDHWTSGGSGTVMQYDLTQEPGEPEVPWRGTHVLRLTTGAGASDVVTATSDNISLRPAIVYTTTANLRFTFADASPTATISVLYFQATGAPSKVRAVDSFAFHQSDGPSGFGTFPVQYVPPSDAASATVQFSIARAGSRMPATLDVDDVR